MSFSAEVEKGTRVEIQRDFNTIIKERYQPELSNDNLTLQLVFMIFSDIRNDNKKH